MNSRIVTVHLLFVLLGLIVAGYSLYVEAMLIEMPGYKPSCDLSSLHMSCSKVFSSKFARMFSYWGIVSPGSVFDISLPQLAIIYFLLLMFAPPIIRRNASLARYYRFLSYCSIGFNIYLAYILKFKLAEFCIVCVSNYGINGVLFFTVRQLGSRSSLKNRKD